MEPISNPSLGPITNVPSPPSVIDFNYVSTSTFGRVTPAYRTEFRITGPNFFPPERSLSGSKRRGGKLSFEFANPLCTEIYSLRGSPTVLRILFVVHILGARGMYPFKKKREKGGDTPVFSSSLWKFPYSISTI